MFLIVTIHTQPLMFITLFRWAIRSVHRGRSNRTEVISANFVANRLGSVSLLNRMGKESTPSYAFLLEKEHMY